MQARRNAILSHDARFLGRFRRTGSLSLVAVLALAGVSLASAFPRDGGDRPERVGPATQPAPAPASTQEAAAESTAPRRDGPSNAPDAQAETAPEQTGPAKTATPQISTDQGSDLNSPELDEGSALSMPNS